MSNLFTFNPMQMFGGGQPTYNTDQANTALRRNVDYTGGKTRDQIEYEEMMRRGNVGQMLDVARDQQRFVADMGNAAANANVARQMASNNQNTLNQVYAAAGDRLNNAANNTMAAINNASQIAAGMFR